MFLKIFYLCMPCKTLIPYYITLTLSSGQRFQQTSICTTQGCLHILNMTNHGLAVVERFLKVFFYSLWSTIVVPPYYRGRDLNKFILHYLRMLSNMFHLFWPRVSWEDFQMTPPNFHYFSIISQKERMSIFLWTKLNPQGCFVELLKITPWFWKRSGIV